jgi:deoxyribose-phosphate aldolase
LAATTPAHAEAEKNISRATAKKSFNKYFMENTTEISPIKQQLANAIEHTNLKADANKEDIILLCEEAVQNGFYGVCVSPYYVQLAKKTLKKSGVKITSVIGFPLGYGTTSAKVEETKKAIMSGADEVDMVININAVKCADWAAVQNDVQAVVTACHLQNKICKVIIETAYLSTAEMEKVCLICKDCGADFIKTSTGFATGGATVEHVAQIKKIVPKIKIKASGGIKDIKFALQLIEAGADRIGTSSGVLMMKEDEK